MPVSRRAFLVTSGVVALAGCVADVDVDGLPERPADPDTESMTAFVAECEHIECRRHSAR